MHAEGKDLNIKSVGRMPVCTHIRLLESSVYPKHAGLDQEGTTIQSAFVPSNLICMTQRDTRKENVVPAKGTKSRKSGLLPFQIGCFQARNDVRDHVPCLRQVRERIPYGI